MVAARIVSTPKTQKLTVKPMITTSLAMSNWAIAMAAKNSRTTNFANRLISDERGRSYACFGIEDHAITGTTHPMDIAHDGYSYHFDACEVEADLRQGKVRITGGTESNGYIHPHVTDGDNICWATSAGWCRG